MLKISKLIYQVKKKIGALMGWQKKIFTTRMMILMMIYE